MFGEIPSATFDFCKSQYERFKIPTNDAVEEVITVGASAALYYLDCIDPYCLFCGLTDVEITDEWSEYAYEIIEEDGRTYEVSPENIETFRVMPHQDEATFNHIMSHPGLGGMPRMLGDVLKDVLDGEYGSNRYDSISSGTLSLLNQLCLRPDGTVNVEMRDAYFDLSAWAASGWLLGPLARDFRYHHHDIVYTAVNYGEAVMVDGAVLSPKSYRRLHRPPRSCMRCGLAAWCVEMTSTISGTRYMCEHCLSEGMPPSPMTTCGSKRCLLAACHHHPYHSMGTAGIHNARRDFGQLGAHARGESAIRISGERRGVLFAENPPK